MGRRLSLEEIYEIWNLGKKGHSYKKISEATGLDKSRIYGYVSRYRLKDAFDFCLASAFHDHSLLNITNPVRVQKWQEKIEELLRREKEKRGLSKNKLVFIGMADIADYYWCAMRSLLKNKEMERAYFEAYIRDRVNYSYKLKGINELPKSVDELLCIGDDIKFDDIEKLLRDKVEKIKDASVWMDAIVEVAGIEEFPRLRGELLHSTKAERYPTIRWNFKWRDYVVVGVPDGITKTFVYEFKTTRNEFLMHYITPVAFTQADLYGCFFRRPRKRVQIYVMKTGEIYTWEENVDKAHAIETLERFKKMDEGEMPLPPEKWKCKRCKFKEACFLL